MIVMLYTVILIIIFLSIAILLVHLHKKMSVNKKIRFFVFMGFFAVLSVASEVFIFNHAFFMSSGNNRLPKEVSTEWSEDIGGINQIKLDFDFSEVKNIYLDCYTERVGGEGTKEGSQKKIEVISTFFDSANTKGQITTSHPVVSTVEKSKYIEYNLSDKVTGIVLNLSTDDNHMVKVNDVKVNVQVPMMMSVKRISIMFVIMVVLYGLRPGSGIYSFVGGNKKISIFSFVLFMIITCVAIFITIKLNDAEDPFYRFAEQRQYARLAEALSRGNVSIGDASEQLISMDNPYDFAARQEMIRNGMPYIWDTAYHDGKYYVYFGITPCVLLYLPYYLVTGNDLPNFAAFLIMAFGFVVSAFFFTERLRKKYAKAMSPLVMHILTSVASFGSIIYISKYSDLYGIPIISGLLFSVLGLYLWLRSLDRIGKVSVPFIGIGSLCMAMVIGSRPQLAILSLMVIPIFWKAVFKERLLFSSKGVVQTILLLLPFVAVIIPLMYYNHVRFGSFTDFGANYNLTSNDMTVRSVNPGRIPSAIFGYFIDPPDLDVRFPFLKAGNVKNTMYQGTVISDPMYGSVFSEVLLLLVPVGIISKVRHYLIKERLFVFYILACVFSVIIAVADAQAAGVLERYLTDFAFILYGAAFLVIISLYNVIGQQQNGRGLLFKIIYALTLLTVIYVFLMAFVSQEPLVGIYNVNQERFYRIFYGISFWI